MTTVSPTSIWHVCEADVFIDGWVPLPVVSIVASEDMDRESYATATLNLGWVSEAIWEALDPRAEDPLIIHPVRWRITECTGDPAAPTVLGYLPGVGVTAPDKEAPARMWIREAERDFIAGTVTVHLAGGETILADKKRIAGTTINTGATTVSGLLEWSLLDVFGGIAYSVDSIVSSTTIPAGDRRLMLPGESHIDLLKPELDAINCRLYDVYGRVWSARLRNTVAGTVKLATYTEAEGAPSNADPIVTALVEKLTRDGDWADGVLIKYDTTSTGGTVAWWASGSGVNTRGRVFEYPRARPAANAADQLVTRTIVRGHETTVTARARFDIRPTYGLEVYTRGPLVTGLIRAVEWNTATGTMTIRAQTGDAFG